MKITLNDSIPAARRAQVSGLLTSLVHAVQIEWRASRFPRYVIFVEPGPADAAEPDGRSIFESPRAATESLASLTASLEDRIKACLAAASPPP